MRVFLLVGITVLLCSVAVQAERPELDQVGQVDMTKAPPRVMPLYEQGWWEGAKVGDRNAGKVGWFFIGFGNVPLIWLPWVVEPRHPAKPPIQAEEEFNSGWKYGYRAGWKNAHKTFYIAGTVVSSAAAAAVILTQED